MLQIIIGAVFWTAFAIPVFEGVLNIGNITGMLYLKDINKGDFKIYPDYG